MVSATNIDATAVNTIAWLAAPDTTIVVPVYQRQYRWDIGACEQLLGDVRAVAGSDDRHMHFIGSILATRSDATVSSELVLIDGQQRITTLMLLIAALHHAVADADPRLAAELRGVLVRADDGERTKLRPHRAWADVFESVVLARRNASDGRRESRFDDNYAYFRSQVSADEAPRVWAGLQKLEHVSISLGAGANAQQIFESLNSTGEPLRDHELIHNYVLMGLSHAEQSEIEDEYWLPIEQNTGESIADFWRHYLVMTTGREVLVEGGRGVYDAFRQLFPRLELTELRAQAARWREYSLVYRTLLEPSNEVDAEIARQLRYTATFGKAMHPLLMRAYFDYAHGDTDRAALIATLEHVQSLVLRRAIVGMPTDRLVARLCRARAQGHDALVGAMARITPSDERVRVALRYEPLPHAAYVLGRLADATGMDAGRPADPNAEADRDADANIDASQYAVEHIFPLAPGDAWTGDGVRTWAEYSDDEQNSHRALAPTLGNLAWLEDALAERAFDRSYPEKRAIYARSDVGATNAVATTDVWNTAAIAARTASLSKQFLQVWARPATAGIDVYIDDDGLTPILDTRRRSGWPRGWQREFDYVEYRGEHWEVFDVKYLFNRVFKRLWNDSHDSAVAFNTRRGGPIYTAQSWNGQWDAIDDEHYLYMGWDSKYMLTAVQGVLDEAGIAAEVFVKYSYIGDAM